MKRIVLAGLAILALPTAAAATITVNINQIGGDVVATASGSLDLAGLTDQGTIFPDQLIYPLFGWIYVGDTIAPVAEAYGGFTGPPNFGSGGYTYNNGSGDPFCMNGFFGYACLPVGYVSGAPITASTAWSGASFSSLGVSPGQYVYSAANGDSITVNIGIESVPESETWAMMLLGFGTIGFAMRQRRSPESQLTA